MEIVAVVGAGTLGGSLAHKLASRERFNQVRLIDTAGGIAAGKAADMQQAAAVERFHTEVTAHEHSDVTAGADVIVLTGPAETPDVEWPEEAGLHLLARVSAVNRGACHRLRRRLTPASGWTRRSQPAVPVDRLSTQRVSCGAAGDRRRRAEMLRIGGGSRGVGGIPPQHVVVPWSEATVRGVGISQLLYPRAAYPSAVEGAAGVAAPGPYTLASATARVCEAIADGTRLRGMSCFVVLDGELKVRGRTAAMMVEVGTAGVTRILDPSLSIQ